MQITLQLWEGVEGYDGERSLGDSTADCARRPVTPAPVTLHTTRTHYGPVSSYTQSLTLRTDISSCTCLGHVHVYVYTCMYSTPDTPPLPTSKILNTCTRTCRNTMYVHNIHERLPSTQDVAGSNPARGSSFFLLRKKGVVFGCSCLPCLVS